MTSAARYIDKYQQVKTVQDWLDLLNDPSINYFELTEAISLYRAGQPTFWKVAHLSGDWQFDHQQLPSPTYLHSDVVNNNMVGSERAVLEKTGFQYGYNRHEIDPVCQQLVDALELENISANVNVQPPGGVKNLHIDTLTCFYNHNTSGIDFTKMPFDHATRQPKGFPRMYRMLVALSDWQPGWMVQLGVEQWVNWKKGDVIAIDWVNVSHCTANASFVSRPLLKITASAKNNWIQDHIDSSRVKQVQI